MASSYSRESLITYPYSVIMMGALYFGAFIYTKKLDYEISGKLWEVYSCFTISESFLNNKYTFIISFGQGFGKFKLN